MNETTQTSQSTPSGVVQQTAVAQKPVDTHSYKGWLNSDVFYKRALAVLGYQIAGQIIIGVGFLALFIVIAIVIRIVF